MVNSIFIDTNILFDAIDISRPNSNQVKKLFSLLKNRDISLCISAITINNIIYVMQNRFKMEAGILKKKLSTLLQLFEVVPYDMEIIVDGLMLNLEDIEDSFQYISALKCKANYLLTEDKHFIKHAPITNKLTVLCTKDFLQVLASLQEF